MNVWNKQIDFPFEVRLEPKARMCLGYKRKLFFFEVPNECVELNSRKELSTTYTTFLQVEMVVRCLTSKVVDKDSNLRKSSDFYLEKNKNDLTPGGTL